VTTGKIHCPNCSGTQVYHSREQKWTDGIMLFFQKKPFRCKICNRRFYAHEPTPEGENSQTGQRSM